MNRGVGALAAFALLLATPAAAVPPPPPSPGYTQSWRAIDDLAPFQGLWTGKEVPHTASGDLQPLKAYRSVQRLGGKDVILLEQGVRNVDDGKPFPLASVNAILAAFVAFPPISYSQSEQPLGVLPPA